MSRPNITKDFLIASLPEKYQDLLLSHEDTFEAWLIVNSLLEELDAVQAFHDENAEFVQSANQELAELDDQSDANQGELQELEKLWEQNFTIMKQNPRDSKAISDSEYIRQRMIDIQTKEEAAEARRNEIRFRLDELYKSYGELNQSNHRAALFAVLAEGKGNAFHPELLNIMVDTQVATYENNYDDQAESNDNEAEVATLSPDQVVGQTYADFLNDEEMPTDSAVTHDELLTHLDEVAPITAVEEDEAVEDLIHPTFQTYPEIFGSAWPESKVVRNIFLSTLRENFNTLRNAVPEFQEVLVSHFANPGSLYTQVEALGMITTSNLLKAFKRSDSAPPISRMLSLIYKVAHPEVEYIPAENFEPLAQGLLKTKIALDENPLELVEAYLADPRGLLGMFGVEIPAWLVETAETSEQDPQLPWTTIFDTRFVESEEGRQWIDRAEKILDHLIKNLPADLKDLDVNLQGKARHSEALTLLKFLSPTQLQNLYAGAPKEHGEYYVGQLLSLLHQVWLPGQEFRLPQDFSKLSALIMTPGSTIIDLESALTDFLENEYQAQAQNYVHYTEEVPEVSVEDDTEADDSSELPAKIPLPKNGEAIYQQQLAACIRWAQRVISQLPGYQPLPDDVSVGIAGRVLKAGAVHHEALLKETFRKRPGKNVAYNWTRQEVIAIKVMLQYLKWFPHTDRGILATLGRDLADHPDNI